MAAQGEDSGAGSEPAPSRDAASIRARAEAHVEDAERICRHVLRRLRVPVRHDLLDDLLGEARAALVQAAHTYDPAHGAAFRTYLYYRVSHAVCDALRRDNRAARSHKRAVARLAAQQDLLERLQREDASAQGNELRTLEARVRATRERISALTASVIASRLGVNDPDAHPPLDPPPSPEAAVAREQTSQYVRTAITRLKPGYRDLLRAVYMEGERLSDYADRHGKARSTVSRTHARALKALARTLTAPHDTAAEDLLP